MLSHLRGEPKHSDRLRKVDNLCRRSAATCLLSGYAVPLFGSHTVFQSRRETLGCISLAPPSILTTSCGGLGVYDPLSLKLRPIIADAQPCGYQLESHNPPIYGHGLHSKLFNWTKGNAARREASRWQENVQARRTKVASPRSKDVSCLRTFCPLPPSPNHIAQRKAATPYHTPYMSRPTMRWVH